VIYAGGVRVGLAGGFAGQTIIPSERFYAGGGTTIRGFEEDSIGPLDFNGDPVGGEASFIVNNELRFPMFSIFEGVGFVDFGNIYQSVSEFDPLSVRGSAGPGLRVRTPYFLLRVDYGFKLDRKPGESMGSFYFSIGQTF
jgi:outer membrane protein insertion porin family